MPTTKKQKDAMRAACHDATTRKAMKVSKKAACEMSKAPIKKKRRRRRKP